MADREARRRAICTCQRRRALGHRVTIIVLNRVNSKIQAVYDGVSGYLESLHCHHGFESLLDSGEVYETSVSSSRISRAHLPKSTWLLNDYLHPRTKNELPLRSARRSPERQGRSSQS